MRKSHLFSFAAALSLAFVSIGLSDTAVAQERGTEEAAEVSEMGGTSTLLLIAALVAVAVVAIAVSGGGDDERPVSP